MHRFWHFRDVTVPRTEKEKPLMRSLNLSVACWLSTIAVSWLASALILIYLHLSHKFTSPISYMHLCTLSALILCFVCNIILWTIHLITKCVHLSQLPPKIWRLFRWNMLRQLWFLCSDCSAWLNICPWKIQSAPWKVVFPFSLNRRKMIGSPSIPIITSFGSIFFTYKNTFIK